MKNILWMLFIKNITAQCSNSHFIWFVGLKSEIILAYTCACLMHAVVKQRLKNEKLSLKKTIVNGSRIKENGLFYDFKTNLLMWWERKKTKVEKNKLDATKPLTRASLNEHC